MKGNGECATDWPNPYDEEVEKDLLKGPQMKVMCAWHPKLFGTELVMREADPGMEKAGVSHGICEECMKRERKRIIGMIGDTVEAA